MSTQLKNNWTERARSLVDRWLASPSTDVEVTEEGYTLRDVLTDDGDGDEARRTLERRIADALRRAARS